MEILLRWVIGLGFALGVGHLVTKTFLDKLRAYLQYDMSGMNLAEREVPAWLMGILERLFFTVLITFNISAAAAAVMGWLAIKMATDWNRIRIIYGDPTSGAVPRSLKAKDEAKLRVFAVSGLLGSLLSMFFALVGGLICKGDIWWWPR
jgi:hypothetical protein